jgi:tRNA threonylcarbamoyladenosine biosynthesis protein TsaE
MSRAAAMQGCRDAAATAPAPPPCISRSPAETEALAANFAERLRPGTVVALHGELGAGKTVFARGIARALGITEPVTSPTFTLIQEYDVPGAPHGIRRLCHLDLYRIETPDAAAAFGIDEYLDATDTVLLIEWPERLGPALPDHVRHVHLRHRGMEEREIAVD